MHTLYRTTFLKILIFYFFPVCILSFILFLKMSFDVKFFLFSRNTKQNSNCSNNTQKTLTVCMSVFIIHCCQIAHDTWFLFQLIFLLFNISYCLSLVNLHCLAIFPLFRIVRFFFSFINVLFCDTSKFIARNFSLIVLLLFESPENVQIKLFYVFYYIKCTQFI